MNEEMMNNEVTTENFEDVEVFKVIEEPQESENGGIAILAAGAAVIVTGAVALWHFTKEKREEMTIRRLEKKGYKVTKESNDTVSVDFEVVSEDDESKNDK